MWKNNDPRIDIPKIGNIVILRKNKTTGKLSNVGHAIVDTKNSCSIITSYKDSPLLNSNDSWDNSWFWCAAP